MLQGSPVSLLEQVIMPGDVTVLANATNLNIFAGNILPFQIPENNMECLMFFSGTRLNTAAGGTGSYFFTVDGVLYIPGSQIVAGVTRTSISLVSLIAINMGGHTFSVGLTAGPAGDETVHTSGTLQVLSFIGASRTF